MEKNRRKIILLLPIFLTCQAWVIFVEGILHNAASLGSIIMALSLGLCNIGLIGIFLSILARLIMKKNSIKNFFMECLYEAAGFGIGISLSAIYLIVRLILCGVAPLKI